ncbi:MAG: outer rane chaperone Skp (OmpH) [Bacteroidetes bacterium]|jgi:outer membrane protein|nr:outer rane chaperone Skp (OmpH) [Bacteroidota bacterium]
MSTAKTVIISSIVSIVAVTLSLAVNQVCFTKKIAYVKLNDVYTKFDLTKNYEQKAEKASSIKNNILDSLKLQLETNYRILQNQKESGKMNEADMVNFNQLRQQYTEKKESFERTNEQMLKSYDEQIWTQINTYIIEFGKEKNYDLLLGANGSGSIMYSDDAIDVTAQAIEFINAKHKGK